MVCSEDDLENNKNNVFLSLVQPKETQDEFFSHLEHASRARCVLTTENDDNVDLANCRVNHKDV